MGSEPWPEPGCPRGRRVGNGSRETREPRLSLPPSSPPGPAGVSADNPKLPRRWQHFVPPPRRRGQRFRRASFPRGLSDALTRPRELLVLTPELSPSHCPGDPTGLPPGPSGQKHPALPPPSAHVCTRTPGPGRKLQETVPGPTGQPSRERRAGRVVTPLPPAPSRAAPHLPGRVCGRRSQGHTTD